MFDSAGVCVGCKHPIVNETIKGDMTLRYGHISINSKELVVGARSGCRNCAVIFDAITTFVGNPDPTSRHNIFEIFHSAHNGELKIAFGECIEVVRCTGNSDQFTSMLKLTLCTDHSPGFENQNSDVWNARKIRALCNDTSSFETLRIIRDWKTSCMEHHEHCMQRVASPLPKRILEIGITHICLREQPGISAWYACLSHCWGPDGPTLKLGADTVERLREGVLASDLPKTFRDAVEVCHHLGIRYLWIDALCEPHLY
jgi:hypothetical protein